jgi:hypothetical protein
MGHYSDGLVESDDDWNFECREREGLKTKRAVMLPMLIK